MATKTMIQWQAHIKNDTNEAIRSLWWCLFWFERFALQLILHFLFSSRAQVFLFVPAVILLSTSSFFIAIGLPDFETDSVLFYLERVGILIFLLHFCPGGSIASAIIGASILLLANFFMLQQYLRDNLPSYLVKFAEIKDSLLKNIHESVSESSDKAEILQMNETSKDGKVQMNVEAAEDVSDGLQVNVENTIARDESKSEALFEKIDIAACNEVLQENRNNYSINKEKEVVINACEVKAEAGSANDWEDVLRNELEKVRHEVQETKDKHECEGNNESDGDNSWEEVQSMLVGRIPVETKSAEEKETEGEEMYATSDCDYSDSEESSWEQGQTDTSIEELLYEYEELSLKREQENKDLIEKLNAATKNLEHYQLMEKGFAEDRLKWNEEVRHLQANLNSFSESLDKERLKWQDEKNELCIKLKVAEVSIEWYKRQLREWEEEKNALDATISMSADEKDVLYSKLEVADTSIQLYKKEFQKWGEENNALNDTIKAADDVKDELRSKLAVAELSIEHYKIQCLESDLEKNALNATISAANDMKDELHSKLEAAEQSIEQHKSESEKWNEEKIALNENLRQCQDLANNYAQQYQILETQLYGNAPTSVNSTIEDQSYYTLNAANSSAESSYQSWYYQSEQNCQYYMGRLMESDRECRKLREDNLGLSAKLFNETLSAERHKRFVEELEDKCRKLEDDKANLNAKLCAAKASSELYKSCLHNF